MVKPAEKFPWAGNGLFIEENESLVSRGRGGKKRAEHTENALPYRRGRGSDDEPESRR